MSSNTSSQGVPVNTASGLAWNTYATARAYFLDMDGLPQFYKDVLRNDHEMALRIPQSILDAPPRRVLAFSENINIIDDYTTDKWIPNLLGLFTYVTGDLSHERCNPSCQGKPNSKPRFPKCVRLPHSQRVHVKGTLKTSCACCMFNGNNSCCSLK